jgi:hypothetical protein
MDTRDPHRGGPPRRPHRRRLTHQPNRASIPDPEHPSKDQPLRRPDNHALALPTPEIATSKIIYTTA